MHHPLDYTKKCFVTIGFNQAPIFSHSRFIVRVVDVLMNSYTTFATFMKAEHARGYAEKLSKELGVGLIEGPAREVDLREKMREMEGRGG